MCVDQGLVFLRRGEPRAARALVHSHQMPYLQEVHGVVVRAFILGLETRPVGYSARLYPVYSGRLSSGSTSGYLVMELFFPI
jgi:hypothetical protein